MAKLGLSSWLILVVLTSQCVWCRPKEVRLITEPSPGQEYVNIRKTVVRQEPAQKKITTEPEGDFATSHKIPRPLPEEDPEYDEEVVEESVVTPTKIKRMSGEPLKTLQEALLTPELLPSIEPETRTEVRMEFSVVTSKPRKEMRDGLEKTPRGGTKSSLISKKLSVKPGVNADVKDVEIDSKGNFGKLAGNLSGSDEKKVMMKKQIVSEGGSVAKTTTEEQVLKEVEVKPASEAGVKSPQVETEEGAITVPIQKQQAGSAVVSTTTPVTFLTSHATVDKGFDILPVNHIAKRLDATKDKDFDFEDSPLGDKVLVPAGSNQQSRIEVKKGPNGQDYEYEYVYYYYDDEENDTVADNKKTTPEKSSTASPAAERATTTSRHYLPEVSVSDKDIVDHGRGRGRNRNQAAVETPDVEFGGRNTNKYSSIERTKEAAVVPEGSNEIIPSRGTQTRSRGRTVAAVTTEEPATASTEERLPANTRFPPRSRSNHNSNSIPVTTPLPHTPEAPVTRIRGGNSANSVRRPSLELVDSSSFKTQSSDASRDQDLRPEFPSSLPGADEEPEVVVKPRGSRVRATTTTTPATEIEIDEDDVNISDAPRRGQPSRRPAASKLDEEDEEGEEPIMTDVATESLEGRQPVDTDATKVTEVGLTVEAMDKAAIELYSLFQQAQAENSIDESTDLSDDDITTELEDLTTTPQPTTTTTTTTTTTPAPTTTTTTTEEPSTTVGRGRYRQRGTAGATGTRNRFRSNSGSSNEVTSTTEAPVEVSTKARARFGSSRVTSGNFGRRGFQKSTTSAPEDSDREVEVVREVASAAPAVRTSAFSRNRFSAARTSRIPSTTTSAPSDDSGSSSSTPLKPQPAFADRFNSLRRRGGAKASTTSAPAVEDSKSESSGEEANEQATVGEAASTTAKPQGRTRLSIGSGPRPLRPGPRVNIGNRGRLGVTTTTTTQAPSTEVDEVSNEQTSSSSQEESPSQSQSDEAQEVVTTAAPDALTRLRNRPRLRVNAARPVASTTSAPVRRPLGLLPRRRPQPAEVKESSESDTQDSSNASSNSEESELSSSSDETSEPSTDATSSGTTVQEPAPENNRLSSLLNGRRKGHALRRPQSQFSAGGR